MAELNGRRARFFISGCKGRNNHFSNSVKIGFVSKIFKTT